MEKIFVFILALYSLSFSQVDSNKVTFFSSDSTFQIIMPKSWSKLKINENADIQVGNMKEDAYLIVISDNKDDLYGWNLPKHSFLTLGNILRNLVNPTIEGPFTKEINEKKAIQFKLKGIIEGINIVYIHTTVETEKYFNQIIAWSIKSKYSENEKHLMNVINSFKDLSDKN